VTIAAMTGDLDALFGAQGGVATTAQLLTVLSAAASTSAFATVT
jgi:hypothetical protein